EDGGEGGDRGAADDEELEPAPEEPEESPVPLAQQDVVAARLRVEGDDLGVGEGADQREQAAEDPDERGHAEERQLAGDGRRLLEDARADDRPRDHRGGHDGTESTKETGVRRG